VKVAFLSDYYSPHEVGGAERSAHRLAIGLERAGVEVFVATPNYGAPARECVDGVPIVRLPFPQRLIPGQLASRRWLSNPVLQASYGLRLARLLRQFGSTVLHVQNSGLVIAGALAGRLARIPVIVTIRDLAYLRPEPQSMTSARTSDRVAWALDHQWSRVERRLKRRALSRAEIVFVSRGLLDVYAKSGYVDLARRGHVVYNIGPDAASAPVAPRDPMMVLFVGKLSEGKGVQVLYRAAERIRDALPSVRFVLVGLPGVGFTPPPPAVARLFSLAGRLDAKRVADLMNRASVLVAPSIWPEPLSRVLLEAMRAELPIVATAVGGTPEALTHGASALLVPPDDAESLAEGLRRLLTEPAYATTLAAEARRRFEERFRPEVVLPQVLAVYERARARY
jgi:glycosyltransferase involved in cell wall biosynthesis